MGRQSPLDGVTAAALWLASDAARHVTGAHIPPDGAGNISVTEEWRHLSEDLLAEHGDTSSRWRRPHLTAIKDRELSISKPVAPTMEIGFADEFRPPDVTAC